jgi:hypothetical protein
MSSSSRHWRDPSPPLLELRDGVVVALPSHHRYGFIVKIWRPSGYASTKVRTASSAKRPVVIHQAAANGQTVMYLTAWL